ncbi:helix-turn-helix domain-containing protein [Halomarina oriensis]|uniref:Transcriptional regulator n=1 Tax=Halomarina oriensis TaxID=671145 RepID=A0A6B0GRZ6_9EURY|nr:multiprotein-bridging factor 1 family protein [Halomarina oriensis]MWG36077.1 transcriptional regulator [Halomarina oriensis]
MAKYSTGGVGSRDSDSCELCGAEGRSLEAVNVEGAVLQVCSDCQRHGSSESRGSGGSRSGDRSTGDEDRDRKLKAVRAQARMDDARKGDSKRWEEGADYEDDPLPYLVKGYGDVVVEAREERDLSTADLAGDVGVREADLVAVEQGRATSAGIGGSVIEALEERLGVRLAEN